MAWPEEQPCAKRSTNRKAHPRSCLKSKISSNLASKCVARAPSPARHNQRFERGRTKVHEKYLGDSYDLVKRFWCESLGPVAPLYAHPRFVPSLLMLLFFSLHRRSRSLIPSTIGCSYWRFRGLVLRPVRFQVRGVAPHPRRPASLNLSHYHLSPLILLHITPRYLRIVREHRQPFLRDRARVILFLALDRLHRK